MARGIDYVNEYTPLVIEFVERHKLQKMGYVFPSKDLTDHKARIFCEIALKFDQIKAEKMKEAMHRGK